MGVLDHVNVRKHTDHLTKWFECALHTKKNANYKRAKLITAY